MSIMPPTVEADLSDEEREELRARFQLWPTPELIHTMLVLHSLIERGRASVAAKSVCRLLHTVIFQRLAPEDFEKAIVMTFGDEEPRFPDLPFVSEP